MKSWKTSIAVVCAVVLWPMAAWALINPDFTPIRLVGECDTILVVQIKGKQVADRTEFEVVKALKGDAPAGVIVDLTKQASTPEQSAAVRKHLAAFAGEPMMLAAATAQKEAYLHVHGKWLKLTFNRINACLFVTIDESKQGTWAGGTDMLIRCVQYIQLAGKAASVPVEPRIKAWRSPKKIGSVAGESREIAAVDLTLDGKLCLFVASDKGDRLFRPSKESFEDITEKVKLASASVAAMCGDFDGDGRVELASYDGKEIAIWSQSAEGSFTKGATMTVAGCVGLAAISLNGTKAAGLLTSRADGSIVLMRKAERDWAATPIAAPTADLGKAGACIVADFNGDSLPDIVQPSEKGGLVYLGAKDGSFEKAKPCAVCCAPGGRASVGDFDNDGMLDVLIADASGVRVYQNLGEAGFAETLGLSGEIAYKPQPLATCAVVGDFDNDSRQDLVITYGAAQPLMYFNRGFRSFGQCPKLEQSLDRVPDLAKGQQLCLLGDFHNNGAQDLLLVLKNGDICHAANEIGGDSALCIKARLGPKSPMPGPVAVTLWDGKQCLGAAVTQCGASPAFFGLKGAGKYTLKWTWPGGAEMTKAVAVDDVPVMVELDGK